MRLGFRRGPSTEVRGETVWKLRVGSIMGSHESAERRKGAPFWTLRATKNARPDPYSHFPDSHWRNCLENRDEWVDALRSRAWKSAIRPIYPMLSGSVCGSISRLPTSEDDQEPTTLARSQAPSTTS